MTVRNMANIDRPSFNAKLSSVLDKHAPPSLRKVITHNSSPWLESIRDELFIAKREGCQAERKQRNTKLTIFKDLYRQAKHKVSKLVHAAKCKFYTERIALASSIKELHQIVNALYLDSILPSLTDLFNSFLASVIFPQCFKSALVTPILKKRCLDHNVLNNYRPVYDPYFIAKILEKLVLSQVSSFLNSHNLYNTCQSAYRPDHSTETALLKVVNDLFLSLDIGNISVLALLDFSSAFDTIDHPILVHHLHTDFGFTDAVLQWFSSYLTDRTHYVYIIISISI